MFFLSAEGTPRELGVLNTLSPSSFLRVSREVPTGLNIFEVTSD